MRIELTIEHLILHELPAHQRQRIAAGLERELTRLMSQAKLSFAPPEYGLRLDAVPLIEVDTRLKPEQIGAAAAEKIYALLQERTKG